MNADAKGIRVGGSAATEEQVLRYYGRLLYDSGRFSTVIISSIDVDEDGVVLYDVIERVRAATTAVFRSEGTNEG